jgi:hypothetical protein
VLKEKSERRACPFASIAMCEKVGRQGRGAEEEERIARLFRTGNRSIIIERKAKGLACLSCLCVNTESPAPIRRRRKRTAEARGGRSFLKERHRQYKSAAGHHEVTPGSPRPGGFLRQRARASGLCLPLVADAAGG